MRRKMPSCCSSSSSSIGGQPPNVCLCCSRGYFAGSMLYRRLLSCCMRQSRVVLLSLLLLLLIVLCPEPRGRCHQHSRGSSSFLLFDSFIPTAFLGATGKGMLRQHMRGLRAAGPPQGHSHSHATLSGGRRQQLHVSVQQPEGFVSLYNYMQQQQAHAPADDGLLEQLMAPQNKQQHIEALRQVGHSSFLSHLQRPVLPVDLRPWFQHELVQEERKLAALSQQLHQLLLLQRQQSSGDSVDSVAQQLQQLRDERIGALKQIQYLRERIQALDILLAERQPPRLLLQLLQAAAKESSQPQHRGTRVAAAAAAAAAAASGSALKASDPIPATVAATEAADFPVTVPPAAVQQGQQNMLRRFAVIPRWLLGKGLGALGRPPGLEKRQSELEAFMAAGWAEAFPPLQQLPGESPGQAAARRIKGAAVRMVGSYDAQESPLSYMQRMQQLLEQQQQQQCMQQREPKEQQTEAETPRPSQAKAAVAALALQLQQAARSLQLPASALQLLCRYAHQRPSEMVLRGTLTENAELVQRAATDLQQFFSRKVSSAAACLPEETQVDQRTFSVSRQFGGSVRDPVQDWIDAQHEGMRRREQEEDQQVVETAAELAGRELSLLSSEANKRSSRKYCSRKGPQSSFSRVMSQKQRAVIQKSLEAARVLSITEKYLDMLQQVEEDAQERVSHNKAPATSQAAVGANPGETSQRLLSAAGAKREPLEVRQRRVADFIETASTALLQRATECLGSQAVAAGCRIFPGMLVRGQVLRVSRQSAIVDIGVGMDAWLLAKDVLLPLEPQGRGGLRQLLKEGDTIYSVVAVASPKELRLTLLPLRQLAAWEVVGRAVQTQETLVATKQQAIPGGLVVRVMGIQGFLPASHVCDASLLQPQQQLLKHQQPLIVQVLHADVARRRLLVSQRLPLSRTELMLRKVSPGDLIAGTVVDAHPFGCVVEFGSSRALLHVSEISQLPVDASLVFAKGEALKAIVKSYDPATGKIWLSTKALERYPGQILKERQKVFDDAEAASAKYKKQQEEIQQLQEAAAQQLMRSLGMEVEEPQSSLKRAEDFSTPQAAQPSLWWGLKSDSRLLEILNQRLQQQRKAEQAHATSILNNGDASSNRSLPDDEVEPQTQQLPDGGVVRVRVLRDNQTEDVSNTLAAAAAEAVEVRDALQQSRVILRGNWQLPKVNEGPMQNDQWEFI